MWTRVIRQVWGELIRDDHSQNVLLNLTAIPLRSQGPLPDDYGIARTELSPMSAMTVEDGNYTLRYRFNGRLEAQAVRVQDGVLMDPVSV